MTLLLARHGQSVWNEVRRFQGTMDIVKPPRVVTLNDTAHLRDGLQPTHLTRV